MKYYPDFETLVFKGFRAGTPAVALGTYCAQTDTSDILLADDAWAWIAERIQAGDKLIGWNFAFDMLVAATGCAGGDVRTILDAYENEQLICLMKADKMLAIQNGTYRRRSFSLEGAYRSWLNRSVADKGSSHPIIGATKGVKKVAKNRWLRKFAKWQHDLVAGRFAPPPSDIPLVEIPWRYKYALLRRLPLELWPLEAQKYLGSDCIEVAELAPHICAAAAANGYTEAGGLPKHTVFESQVAFTLALTENVGFFTRTEYVKEMQRQAETTMQELQAVLQSHLAMFLDKDGVLQKLLKVRDSGEKKGTLGPNQKALRAMVEQGYAQVGLKPPRTKPSATHKNGQVSINDKVLAETPGRIPEVFRAWAKAARNAEIFCPLLLKKDLRTSYVDTITMRIASKSGEDDIEGAEFNATNLPREGGVRQAFRPPTIDEYIEIAKRLRLPPVEFQPGDRFIILGADYAAAECYTGAINILYRLTGNAEYERGVSQLADDLMDGIDIPTMIASMEFGVSYEAMKKGRKTRKDYKDGRQRAKNVFYGLLGMMGAPTMARQAFRVSGVKFATLKNGMWDISGSIAAAKKTIKIALSRYPDIAAHRRQFDFNSRHQAITFPSELERGDCFATEAGSWIIQPGVARMMKRAIKNIWRRIYGCKSAGSPAGHMGLVVFNDNHDECLAYCLERFAHEGGEVIREEMLASKEIECPGMVARHHVIPIAMEVWEKDIERTEENGRLVVTPCTLPNPPVPVYPWDTYEFEEDMGDGADSRVAAWLREGLEIPLVEDDEDTDNEDWESEDEE